MINFHFQMKSQHIHPLAVVSMSLPHKIGRTVSLTNWLKIVHTSWQTIYAEFREKKIGRTKKITWKIVLEHDTKWYCVSPQIGSDWIRIFYFNTVIFVFVPSKVFNVFTVFWPHSISLNKRISQHFWMVAKIFVASRFPKIFGLARKTPTA